MAQRVQKLRPVFGRHGRVERVVVRRLGQQLGDMPLIVGLDGAQPLRLTAERLAVVQVGVVVQLHERLERDPETLAVTEHPVMVVRKSPRTRIDVQTLVEAAFLGNAAKFGVAVAAAQRPVASAGAGVVLENLNLVSGVAQLIGGDEPGDASTEHEDRATPRGGAKLYRRAKARLGRESETVHRLIHRSTAGAQADHSQQSSP